VPHATLWPPGTRLPYAGLAASAAVVAAWGTCWLLTPRTAVLPAEYEYEVRAMSAPVSGVVVS
jgi:hypothetical protein